MEICVTKSIDTDNISVSKYPSVSIKYSLEEMKALEKAAEICENLAYCFSELEVFDTKEAQVTHDNLVNIMGILSDYRVGEKTLVI